MIPKFTAEVALGQTSAHYRGLWKRSRDGEQGIVAAWTDNEGCWHFEGDCTGFWPFYRGTQCVIGPAAQRPDAEIVEHCCSRASLYPWIKVCGDSLEMGCGYCWF
jgi:hypothetical protein